MNIILNGKNIELADGLSLRDTVARFAKQPEHVITEVNGKIIARAAWEGTPLSPDDKIELITFVGGG
jgi:sulfur carrier protein